MQNLLTRNILIIFLGLSLLAPNAFSNSDEDDIEALSKHRENTVNLIKDLEKFQNSDTSDQEKLDQLKEQMPIKKVFEHYQSSSVEEIEAQLRGRFAGSKMEVVFSKFPKALTFVASLLHDKEAIPLLMEMQNDKEKLKHTFFAIIASFVLSFFIKWWINNNKTFFFKKLLQRFFHIVFIWALRLGILIHFFGANLRPTFNIFKKVFL